MFFIAHCTCELYILCGYQLVFPLHNKYFIVLDYLQYSPFSLIGIFFILLSSLEMTVWEEYISLPNSWYSYFGAMRCSPTPCQTSVRTLNHSLFDQTQSLTHLIFCNNPHIPISIKILQRFRICSQFVLSPNLLTN